MINANIICDSVNPDGKRLTTFVLTYPRFIHSEFMTHRMISRNAASSRAIPIEKMIKAVADAPAAPEQWGANQSGMQAASELTGTAKDAAKLTWEAASRGAIDHTIELNRRGVHKQIANRVLEPFSHITVVATASSWTNFFALRAHPMAQPEFQVLAFRMLDKYLKSPGFDHYQKLDWGMWHLPFIRKEDIADIASRQGDETPTSGYQLAKISAARCARVSYLTHEGIRSIDKDLELYDRLVGSTPLHASALEHPAMALRYHIMSHIFRPSNFHPSWLQLRKTLENENVTRLDLPKVLANKPEWITL